MVSDDKFGHRIEVAQGISVRRGRVTLGGTLAFVHFNRNSMAAPALKAAESLHLTDPDSWRDYAFVKQK